MFYIDMIIFLYLVSIFSKLMFTAYMHYIYDLWKKETNNVAETLITTHKEEIPRSDIIIFIARMINISQYNKNFFKNYFDLFQIIRVKYRKPEWYAAG